MGERILWDVLWVALGGALGASARFLVTVGLPGSAFPWATLLVNLMGSFALGALVLPAGMQDTPRLLWGIGFLGAFTTVSTFSMETIGLLRTGQTVGAALNVLANGLGGPLAAWAGWKLFA